MALLFFPLSAVMRPPLTCVIFYLVNIWYSPGSLLNSDYYVKAVCFAVIVEIVLNASLWPNKQIKL